MAQKKEKPIKVLRGDKVPFTHSDFDESSYQPKILILGTRVTEQSINAGYYYLGLKQDQNAFWSIMAYCFNDESFLSNDANTIKCSLKSHNVVVSDLIYNCEYKGSKNSETIKGTEEPNLDDLIPLVSQSDLVLLNGVYSSRQDGTVNYFYEYLQRKNAEIEILANRNKVLERGFVRLNGKRIPYVALYNTCKNQGGADLETKKNMWKDEIGNFVSLFKKN